MTAQTGGYAQIEVGNNLPLNLTNGAGVTQFSLNTATGNVGIGLATPVDVLSISTAPTASATHALVNLNNTALVGASANGTYIGANPAAASADFINYQVNGTTKFSVDKNGVITGNGSGLTGISGALSGLNPGDVMFATTGTTAGTSGNMTWDNSNYKMTIDAANAPAGDALQISNAPKASATNALVTLGASDIAGGNANGTYIGANAATGYSGDFENYEVNGTSQFEVTGTGSVAMTGSISSSAAILGISDPTGGIRLLNGNGASLYLNSTGAVDDPLPTASCNSRPTAADMSNFRLGPMLQLEVRRRSIPIHRYRAAGLGNGRLSTSATRPSAARPRTEPTSARTRCRKR